MFDLENDDGTPIYVHAKVCVIDDVWVAVGSDNLNRRSWTHDSELSAAVLDETLTTASRGTRRAWATAPGCFARDLRLRLWREHLGRGPTTTATWSTRSTASTPGAGRPGPRPTGTRPAGSAPAHPGTSPRTTPAGSSPGRPGGPLPVYQLLVDPDGRPRRLRRAGRF